MKKYIAPKAEILYFNENTDIIKTSGLVDGGAEGEFGGGDIVDFSVNNTNLLDFNN